MCHKRSSFNNDRAALIPSIARRRVGQVQPEDDLVLVVEVEAHAGGLELCAARVLNADLEASRPILIKLMIHAPPNAHGGAVALPRKLVVPLVGWAARPEDRCDGTDAAVERIATAQRGRRLQFTDEVPLVERSAAVTGKPSTPALPVNSCAIDVIGHDSGAQHK